MSESFDKETSPMDAWVSVERICVTRLITTSKEELLAVIEEPLKPAIGLFFDKNIETLLSSCNLNDYYRGQAWISLNWSTLSEENKQIAEEYPYSQRGEVEGTDMQIVGLIIPIQTGSFPCNISETALEIAERFQEQ